VIVDTSTGAGGPGQGPQGPWAGSGGGRPGSDGRVIGDVDQFAPPVLVHDDAIYLHEGRQFYCERLDWEEKRAYVHPVSVDHFTLAETRTTLQILERYEGPIGDACRRSLGEVRVSRAATMYKNIRFLTHENVGSGPITVPEPDLHTVAACQGGCGVSAGLRWVRVSAVSRRVFPFGRVPTVHVRSARPGQPGGAPRGRAARCGGGNALDRGCFRRGAPGVHRGLGPRFGAGTGAGGDWLAHGIRLRRRGGRCRFRRALSPTQRRPGRDGDAAGARLRLRLGLPLLRRSGRRAAKRQGGDAAARTWPSRADRGATVRLMTLKVGPAAPVSPTPRCRPSRSPSAVAARLVELDPAFATVARAAGPFAPRPRREDAFNPLARAIAYQQLAGRAAAAIHGRFLALYGIAAPTPAAVAATPVEMLRGCGLSGAKAAAILDLAAKFADGTIPADKLAAMADDDDVARLSVVRGVGRWTAEMFLLRSSPPRRMSGGR
jgi:HhH-GPD superfamily base excision DNA repair protein